jgi:hypothetical protein
MAETIFTPAEFEQLMEQLEANVSKSADKFAIELTPLLREPDCIENSEIMREQIFGNVKGLLLASVAQTMRLFERSASDISEKVHAGEAQHLADDADAARSLAAKMAARIEVGTPV